MIVGGLLFKNEGTFIELVFKNIFCLQQNFFRHSQLLFLHQNIIRIIGRDGKDADLSFRQNGCDLCKDTRQAKVERSQHLDTRPAYFALLALERDARIADDGEFFLRAGDGEKITLQFGYAAFGRKAVDGVFVGEDG